MDNVIDQLQHRFLTYPPKEKTSKKTKDFLDYLSSMMLLKKLWVLGKWKFFRKIRSKSSGKSAIPEAALPSNCCFLAYINFHLIRDYYKQKNHASIQQCQRYLVKATQLSKYFHKKTWKNWPNRTPADIVIKKANNVIVAFSKYHLFLLFSHLSFLLCFHTLHLCRDTISNAILKIQVLFSLLTNMVNWDEWWNPLII